MSENLFSRVDTVFLPVRALDTASAWYRQVLGWEVVWSSDCIAILRAGETAFTLVQHAYPGMAEAPEGFVFRPREEIAFNLHAPDLDAAHAALAGKGAAVGPIMDRGGVREFLFNDPDGNCLSVVNC